jgi:hypothetical protein
LGPTEATAAAGKYVWNSILDIFSNGITFFKIKQEKITPPAIPEDKTEPPEKPLPTSAAKEAWAAKYQEIIDLLKDNTTNLPQFDNNVKQKINEFLTIFNFYFVDDSATATKDPSATKEQNLRIQQLLNEIQTQIETASKAMVGGYSIKCLFLADFTAARSQKPGVYTLYSKMTKIAYEFDTDSKLHESTDPNFKPDKLKLILTDNIANNKYYSIDRAHGKKSAYVTRTYSSDPQGIDPRIGTKNVSIGTFGYNKFTTCKNAVKMFGKTLINEVQDCYFLIEPYPNVLFKAYPVPYRTTKKAMLGRLLTAGLKDMSIQTNLLVFKHEKMTLGQNGKPQKVNGFVVVDERDIGPNNTEVALYNDQNMGDNTGGSLSAAQLETGQQYKFVNTTYLELQEDEVQALRKAIRSNQVRPKNYNDNVFGLANNSIKSNAEETSFIAARNPLQEATNEQQIQADLQNKLNNPETTTLPPPDLAPGTLAPGTLPPGTLPPGTLPPGTLAPGTLPPGTLAPGTLPPGTLAPGTADPRGSAELSGTSTSGVGGRLTKRHEVLPLVVKKKHTRRRN